MKKLTIIYIISAFVLTSFTGCTKFRETTRDFQKLPQHSDSSDAASIVNNKESWSEWTSRQWNKSSVKWISGIVSVAVIATGCYVAYKKLWSKKEQKPQTIDVGIQADLIEIPPQNLNNIDISECEKKLAEMTKQCVALDYIIETVVGTIESDLNLINISEANATMTAEIASTSLLESAKELFAFSAYNYNYFSNTTNRPNLVNLSLKAFRNFRTVVNMDKRFSAEDVNQIKDYTNQLVVDFHLPLKMWE